jgi:hypothetical protein
MRFFIVKTDLGKFLSPNHQNSYEISLISHDFTLRKNENKAQLHVIPRYYKFITFGKNIHV